MNYAMVGIVCFAIGFAAGCAAAVIGLATLCVRGGWKVTDGSGKRIA